MKKQAVVSELLNLIALTSEEIKERDVEKRKKKSTFFNRFDNDFYALCEIRTEERVFILSDLLNSYTPPIKETYIITLSLSPFGIGRDLEFSQLFMDHYRASDIFREGVDVVIEMESALKNKLQGMFYSFFVNCLGFKSAYYYIFGAKNDSMFGSTASKTWINPSVLAREIYWIKEGLENMKQQGFSSDEVEVIASTLDSLRADGMITEDRIDGKVFFERIHTHKDALLKGIKDKKDGWKDDLSEKIVFLANSSYTLEEHTDSTERTQRLIGRVFCIAGVFIAVSTILLLLFLEK